MCILQLETLFCLTIYASFHNFPLYLMADGVIPLPFQRHEDRITTITWIKHVVLAESHLAVVLIIVRTSFTFLRDKFDLVPFPAVSTTRCFSGCLLWMCFIICISDSFITIPIFSSSPTHIFCNNSLYVHYCPTFLLCSISLQFSSYGCKV